jgi:hypothetical protein
MGTSDRIVSVLIVSLSLAFQPPMDFRYPSVNAAADFQSARQQQISAFQRQPSIALFRQETGFRALCGVGRVLVGRLDFVI